MPWTISFADEFEPEFDELDPEVQDAILAAWFCSSVRVLRSDDRMPTP